MQGEMCPHRLAVLDKTDSYQKYCFDPDGDAFNIWCPASNLSFDSDGTEEGGIPLGSWGYEIGNPNQQFMITPAGKGKVTISHKGTGCKVLIDGDDVEGAMVRLGGKDDRPTEWRLIPAKCEFLESRGKEDWENETIFAINKLPGHVTMVSYPSSAALKADREWALPRCFHSSVKMRPNRGEENSSSHRGQLSPNKVSSWRRSRISPSSAIAERTFSYRIPRNSGCTAAAAFNSLRSR